VLFSCTAAVISKVRPEAQGGQRSETPARSAVTVGRLIRKMTLKLNVSMTSSASTAVRNYDQSCDLCTRRFYKKLAMVTLKGEELKRMWHKTYEDHKENQSVLAFTKFHTRLKDS